MKKILLLLVVALPLVFTSCSKDENNAPLSVMANVLIDGSIANPSLVRLYTYESAKNFDKNGISQMGDSQKLVNMSGNEIKPTYTSNNFSGANIFENIKSGKYILIVMYKPSGYSFPMFYFYGYKVIDVNIDTNASLYNIQFKYDDRGKFKEF